MKKILTLLLALLLVVAVAACSDSEDEETTDEPEAQEDTAETEDDEPAEEPEDEDEDEDDEDDGDDGVVITSVDDLDGLRIGVQQGTTGALYAEWDLEDADVMMYNKGADAVMALQQGNVDAVIIDEEPAKVFVSQNDDLELLDEAFTVEDYAICLAKDSELTAQFDEAIDALKADGTLDALVDYWINDEDGAEPYTSPEGTEYPNGTLTMATNAEFPPYEFNEGGEVVGLDADFARAICDYLGYELVIDDMDFDSIILAVQSGKAEFGAAGMTVTEERLENVDFTQSYYTSSQRVIIKK